MSANRVVVALTPIFTGLAAWLVGWCSTHLPGHPKLDSGEITALMVAGAGAALSMALKWLHGWQADEKAKRAVVEHEAATKRMRAAHGIDHA